jgi:hypothetical protein
MPKQAPSMARPPSSTLRTPYHRPFFAKAAATAFA